ncbi:hypothetical protein BpHYR1_001122 [Brachionus plicatilis]|uniref:RING-type domain-containing protein n=1 Tax=Brachionus plicatilis TaxID=10195 RepID=A0A3M7P1G5_BRAPC|nr:hypothetical protein BpHYR1_001122 [Brachionus plicatilis]
MSNKNLINCEFCFTKVEDLDTITLPCGYVVCSVHLESDDAVTKCVVCSEHTFDKSACYKMAKNSSKQKELNFRKKITLVNEKIDQIGTYFEDPDKFLDEYLNIIENEVTDRAQELKNDFNQQISDYKEIKEKIEENNFDKAKIIRINICFRLEIIRKCIRRKVNQAGNKEKEFIDPVLDLINKNLTNSIDKRITLDALVQISSSLIKQMTTIFTVIITV